MKLIIKDRPAPYFAGLWCSKLCSCMPDGYIVKYIRSIQSDKTMAIPWSDGFSYISDQLNNRCEIEGYDEDVILGLQSSLIMDPTNAIKNKLLCLPLDDDIFEYGLRKVLENEPFRVPNLDLPWSQRKSVAFWRGAGPHPLRQKVIEELFGHEYSNVLYGRIPQNTPDQYTQKWWDPTYEGKWQPIELSEFVKHKYIIIIDNRIITSSYQWVFGTGSVPILVNHPMDDFWFKEYLIPWVNYVPVTHPDFGVLNIKNVIEFLVKNDDIAHNIAENALELSRKIFSPEFQREYIKNKIDAIPVDRSTHPAQFKIIQSPDGCLWGVNSDDHIWMREGNQSGTGWTRIDGILMNITVGPTGQIWGVNRSDQVWFREGITAQNPRGTSWKNINGLLTNISVGKDGCVLGVNQTGQIWLRDGISAQNPAGTSWKLFDDGLVNLKIIQSPDGCLWGVNNDDHIWLREGQPTGTGWARIDGLLMNITIGPTGQMWGINRSDHVWFREGITAQNPRGTSWNNIDGLLTNISVGKDGCVLGVNREGQICLRDGISTQNPTGTSWKLFDSGLVGLS